MLATCGGVGALPLMHCEDVMCTAGNRVGPSPRGRSLQPCHVLRIRSVLSSRRGMHMVQRAGFIDGVKGGNVWLPRQLLGINVEGV